MSLPDHRLCGVLVCHDTTVMTYAPYLRIYEPVSAFHEPGRSGWMVVAAAPARPRRIGEVAGGERELAAATYMRAHRRRRAFAEFESAN